MPSRTGKELLFEARPHLRAEWDYEKNIGIDPEKLTAGSGVDAWWVCLNHHSWKARIQTRGKVGYGCGQCVRENYVKNNPLSADKELSSQLDDPRYKLAELSRGSAIAVWWKCHRGHRWEARINSRKSADVGCPFCGGRSPIVGETDLATLRPDLATQWDDEHMKATEVTVSSATKVRWKCIKGHQFEATVNSRTQSRTKGSGCPYCSKGRYARTVVGVNDLDTLHPMIAAELCSPDVSAQDLREYSNKRLLWRCIEGHEYTASVSDRVLGSGCAKCSIAHTSKIEGRLRSLINSQEYLSGTILDANHKLLVPWRKNKTMSVDIYCEWQGVPVVIEYDGVFWHHRPSSVSRDSDKTDALLSHGYIVVRIRENGLPHLEVEHSNLLQLSVDYSHGDKNLEEAIESVEKWLNNRT